MVGTLYIYIFGNIVSLLHFYQNTNLPRWYARSSERNPPSVYAICRKFNPIEKVAVEKENTATAVTKRLSRYVILVSYYVLAVKRSVWQPSST